MPELLAAADVLVHSTGGVTCLEARAAGTPVVSYGLPVGHARLNTRAMAALDLLRLANDTDELREHVQASFADEPARPSGARRRSARRTRPPSRSCSRRRGACARSRAGGCARSRSATQIALVLGARRLDDVDRRGHDARGEGAARAPAGARRHRPARRRARSCARPPRGSPVLASQLAARGIHVSFADDAGVPSAAARRRAAPAAATSCCPKCPSSSPLRWVQDARACCARRRARSACTTASTTCSRRAACRSASSCSRAPTARRRSRARCG